MPNDNIGTDKVSKTGIIYMLSIVTAFIVLAFYAVPGNVPPVQEQALVYLILIVAGVTIWTVSKVIVDTKEKGDIEFPNPPIFEQTTSFGFKIPKWAFVIMTVGILILGGFIFLQVSQSPIYSIVAAPTYQAVPLTPETSTILTIFSAWAEDFLFFIVIPAIVFGWAFVASRNFWVSLIIAMAISPFIFMIFHIGRYGLALAVTTQTVFFFGLIMIAWTMLIRNPVLPWVLHSSNNAALAFFALQRPDISLYFYTFVIAIIILSSVYLWRRGFKD